MKVYGEVVELWRYPVKSMLGEPCRQIEVEMRGVQGDRLFALQDEAGRFGSGKDTRRFRKIDGLFSLQARFAGQVPLLQLPDGREIAGDDPEVDAVLSGILGQPVSLVREAGISHFDDQPVHLLTRGSLQSLRDIAPEGMADSRRFRPNIVLSTDSPSSEQEWLGKRVRIGEAELEFTRPTERCAMITFAQSDLLKAPQILKQIAKEHELRFGVYAKVLVPGGIRLGDVIAEVR